MKFYIRRTSQWDDDTPPCKEAYRDTYTRVDRRTTDDPKKIPKGKGSDGTWWYAEGENHRVEHGQIVRDFPGDTAWFIDINTLEDLMGLYEKYGDLVLTEWGWKPGPMIEIYDDDRE